MYTNVSLPILLCSTWKNHKYTGYTRIHLQTDIDILFITSRQSLRRQSLRNFHTFKVHTYIISYISLLRPSFTDLNMKCHLSTFCEKEEYLITDIGGDAEMRSIKHIKLYLQYQNTCMTMKVHYRFVIYLRNSYQLCARIWDSKFCTLIFTIIKVTVL